MFNSSESDKLIWTKSGYIYEFEIKISRSDFKNDFKHKKDKHIILKGPTDEEQLMPSFYESYEWNKHLYKSIDECKARLEPTDQYYIANHRKPNFFYYAVPDGLIKEEEVPEYAGLIYIPEDNESMRIIKKAPQLHKEKYTDAQLNLAPKFYYNFVTARNNAAASARETEQVRNLLKEELDSKGQEITYHQLQQQLKMAQEDLELYKERYNRKIKDNLATNAERKRLRKAILQLDPNFDFKPIEEEVDKLFNIK